MHGTKRPATEYFSAFPKSGAVTAVHRYYRSRAKRSLTALVATASSALRRGYPDLERNLELLDIESRFSPSVYAFNYLLQQAMKKNDAAEVAALLSELSGASAQLSTADGPTVTNLLSRPWHSLIVRELIRMDLRDLSGNFTVLQPVSENELLTARQHISEAVALIEECYPVIGQEVRSLVAELTLFNGQVISGATDVRVFGNMFLRMPTADQTALAYYCEHIVHESSHLYLNALLASDPLIRNGDIGSFSAPIRSDPRPLGGILHATFVLSRMIQVFERIGASQPAEQFTRALDLFYLQFASGVKTLKKNGDFTELGLRLYSELEVQVNDRYRHYIAA